MFEFSIPTGKVPQSPRPLAASIAAHGVILLLLFTLRFSASVASFSAREHIMFIAPGVARPAPRAKTQTPRPREFHPPPRPSAHLEAPAIPVIPAPAFEVPKTQVPEIPKIAVTATAPLKPVSGFVEATAPPPAKVATPKLAIRDSGFGAETAAMVLVRNERTTTGSFDSAEATEGAVRKAVARPGGFSDASARISGVAQHAAIASAAFGDTTVDKSTAAPRQTTAARFTPVEIVSKPKPAYTDDARAKKIEGEVLLEMQFSASGEARVLRLMRGLGHGLDETAVAAALGIRFRPATRDGGAVDSSAVVHIVFQLAN